MKTFSLAVLVTVAAVFVRWLLDPWLGDHLALVTLFAAVAITAWLGGFRPALGAAIAGYLACDFLFIGPPYGFGPYDARTAAGLVAFVVSSSILIGFVEALRSARRRARRGRELFWVTLASIGDAVVTTDADGRVTLLNATAESLTGWTTPEAAGRPFEQVVPIVDETTRRRTEDPATRALREGSVLSLMSRSILISRDGTERSIDDRAAAIRDERGRVAGCVVVFRDVSEQRRGERALQRRERELADFFDNASVGLHWVGPDGIILRANQAELDLLGYRREEYVGHDIAEFHVDRSTIEDVLVRLKRGETLRDRPALLRCKDGSIRHVLLTSNGWFEDGEFVHSRCFTVDVTERERAEAARRATEERFRLMADAAPVLIWMAGPEKRCTWFNRPWLEFTGRPMARELGDGWTENVHPDDIEECMRIYATAFEARHRFSMEYRLRRADGQYRWLLDIGTPMHTEGGESDGYIGSCIDITERKRSEEALRRSEERFRELANNIDQFAWTCNELGYATWYNRRWYEYTGTTFEQMRGEGWASVIRPDHLERVAEGIRRSVAAGEPWEDTFPLLRKDGTYRWFLSRSIPIRDAGGSVIRWFGTNTDVTTQRELADALKNADRRKDEFLATLAHELRNPLAPIRYAAQLLLASSNADPELRWSGEVIDRQVGHMGRLLDDLLDLSRISHDKLELRRERTDLASVIETALEAHRSVVEDGAREVTVDLPETPIHLDADPVRLVQIFSNLIDNAMKYSEAGGRVRLKGELRGDRVVVSVEDDGIGIPADLLPRVFDTFSQAPQDRKRSKHGLGIGLSLVRGLVELHGGTIEARSDGPGKGSTFVVRLPAAPPQSAAGPPEPAEEPMRPFDLPSLPPRRSRRILVVDDNHDNADTAAKLLRFKGHDVRTAYDGEEAVEAAAEYRPDLVLLDIGMPRLNGYAACERIRALPGGHSMTLVAVTGWGQHDDRRRTKRAGFDHHLVKPIDPDELARLLASPYAGDPGPVAP